MMRCKTSLRKLGREKCVDTFAYFEVTCTVLPTFHVFCSAEPTSFRRPFLLAPLRPFERKGHLPPLPRLHYDTATNGAHPSHAPTFSRKFLFDHSFHTPRFIQLLSFIILIFPFFSETSRSRSINAPCISAGMDLKK